MKFGSIIALSLVVSAPLAAQQEARQPDAEQELEYAQDANVRIVETFGNDPCPESTADEIVVCPNYDENDRYRIPKLLRNNPDDPANKSWTERAVSLRTLGDTGTNTCSPVGAGGFAGCLSQLINTAVAQRENAPAVVAGALIEEERQKRLDLIDGEAEDVERRIVEIEKARVEKEAAETAAAEAREKEDSSLDDRLPDLIAPQSVDTDGSDG